MRLVTTGMNRWVWLVGGLAFNVPNPSSWRQVLFGIPNSLNERDWSVKPGRCPVCCSSWGGTVIVMPRARILTDADFSAFSPDIFCAEFGVRAEHKPDTFGYLDGKIVAVEYGW